MGRSVKCSYKRAKMASASPESVALISRTYSLRDSRSTVRVRLSWPLEDRLKAPSSFPPLST